MKTIEVQGKSVDEAIFRGLDQLGLSIDEVTIEILEEGGKGFLGIGTKQCLVRLTQRDEQAILLAAQQQAAAAQQEREQRAQRSEFRQERDDRRPPREAQDFRPSQGTREGQPRREGGREGRSRREQMPSLSMNWGTPCEGGAEAEFLRGLLERMGLSCQVDCFLDENCLYMRVSGDGMGVLIGRRGDTLNALQYLTSLVANRGEGDYKRVIVDTENYRVKREETLVRLAKRMADECRTTGRAVHMEPMNPYERRVLHSTLQTSPTVTTHSEGEEPRRHVVITLR